MSTKPIPHWNDDGFLPAADSVEPTSWERSPYSVSLFGLIERFGTSEIRIRLLQGLLDFRVELHNAGLHSGFQWIDGSFVENVEETANRSPNDIDVVTFFYIPNGHTPGNAVARAP